MRRLPSLHPSALRSFSRPFNPSDTVSKNSPSKSFYIMKILTHFLIALTWRIVYIGQASDSEKDQILEEAEMDEIQPGQMKFVFEVIFVSRSLFRANLPMCRGSWSPRLSELPAFWSPAHTPTKNSSELDTM